MKKLFERLIMFCVAVPLVVCLVLLLPQHHHLAANISVIILSALGSVELAGLLRKTGANIPLAEAALLGTVAPLGMTLVAVFDAGNQVMPGLLMLGACWVMVSRIFSNGEKLKAVFGYITAGFSVLLYPGLFLSWIVRMTRWDEAAAVILVLLFIVIANDSAAWACGMLFGKGNRGIIPASPNKSITGYIGGLSASVLVGLGAVIPLPSTFIPTRLPLPRAAAGVLLGFCSGCAASLGDLSESAIKRSVDTKDSGNIIPGRGGVLDSIDSIALAAPVFYAVYWLLFR